MEIYVFGCQNQTFQDEVRAFSWSMDEFPESLLWITAHFDDFYLVGGWALPLWKNMKVSWGYYSQYKEK